MKISLKLAQVSDFAQQIKTPISFFLWINNLVWMSNPSPVCCQCQQVGALSRFVCKFLVHVDSSVRSGDVIQTNLPSPSPATTRFSVSSNKKQTVDDGVRAVDSDVWRDEILFPSLPREREKNLNQNNRMTPSSVPGGSDLKTIDPSKRGEVMSFLDGLTTPLLLDSIVPRAQKIHQTCYLFIYV